MFVWRLSVKPYYTDICLSVAYIRPKSRTERPRKTKIGTEVAHVTRDSDTTFKVKRSKVNLQGRGGGILWQPPTQLVLFIHNNSFCGRCRRKSTSKQTANVDCTVNTDVLLYIRMLMLMSDDDNVSVDTQWMSDAWILQPAKWRRK